MPNDVQPQASSQVSAVGLPFSVEVKKLLAAAERTQKSKHKNILQRLNRDVVYLSVILILSLLLLAASGFVVASLTAVNVTVMFSSGSTSQQTQTPPAQDLPEVTTEPEDVLSAEDDLSEGMPVLYLLLDRELNPSVVDTQVPDNAVRIEIGAGDNFWVPISTSSVEGLSLDRKLESLLTQNSQQREIIYDGLLLTNPLLLPIKFEVGKVSGEYRVNIVGELNFEDPIAVNYFKSHLETIVSHYTNEYFFTLNGDERAFEQLGL